MTPRAVAGAGAPPALVLVIGSLQGGGAERQLSDMANFWARSGARVTLATWSGPGVPDFYVLAPEIKRVWLDGGTRSSRTLIEPLASIRRIMGLRRLLQRERPYALLSFIDISNVHAILAAHGLPVRVVVAERTHPEINRTIGLPWRILRRLVYSRADRVVAQTQDAARWLARACKARVSVIPNSLRELPEPQSQREPLIVAVGRLSREKGFDVLLRAFAKVSAHFPGWRVCIIGEGNERTALVQLREQLQLGARVEFIGEQRRIEPWLERAGLLVHPSRREGFPNVVLEAMGMGLGVICAACRAGPAELIEDGINGRLIPVDDVDALARVMGELMAAPETRERLGREARKVRQRFRQDLIMEQWQSCLFPQGPVAGVASGALG
jgi:GalNAc-alpha-(1->4)-GalNAc-alpha-(1->3)-diNAcBac-PP-undecaprenol alpha-1,4-N-acetyl-D-galactosaminyltransferase